MRRLTADSVEVSFAVPPELHDEYDYLAGQYVALRKTIDGHELRRSYSICRPPDPRPDHRRQSSATSADASRPGRTASCVPATGWT